MMFKQTQSPKKERGAVLVFALVLLMVMTILGISGIGNSVIQERMSGNYAQSYSAFQSAEFALRVAENWADNFGPGNINTWFRVGGRPGLYSSMSGNDRDEICQGDNTCAFDPRVIDQWCDGTAADCPLHKGFVTLGTNDLQTGDLAEIAASLVDQQPRFVIEYIGRSSETDPRRSFRITAIGWGREPGVYYVLQSHRLVPES